MDNKFELKDGQLSKYALMCGYLQEKHTSKYHVILVSDGDYQLTVWDESNPYNKIYRKSFDYNLTDARKEFKQWVKKGD